MRQSNIESSRVALGFRAHSGWAAMVALREPAVAPLIVMRRQVQLVDRNIEGAAQPYHAAHEMPLKEAAEFLDECRQTTNALATQAIKAAIAELKTKGCTICGACILSGSGRPTGSLESTLASHAMIHTAEGDFYRDALKQACESIGLSMSALKEKEARRMACEKFHHQLIELGKRIGPPWRADEKLSAIAAWQILSHRVAARA